MNHSELPDPGNSESKNEPDNFPSLPQNKADRILQEVEILAFQQGSKSDFNLSNFSDEQIEKLLDILSKNEENAFQFHSKRLEVAKEIELKRIQAANTSQFTYRYAIVGGLIGIPALTVLILLFKDAYFIPWLTFLTGLAGGMGLSKVSKDLTKEPAKNPIVDEPKG